MIHKKGADILWNLKYPSDQEHEINFVFPLSLCIVDMKGAKQLCGMFDSNNAKRPCVSCKYTYKNLDKPKKRCENILQKEMRTIINLGTGEGHSIKQVITAFEQLTGQPLNINSGPRRPGDPAAYFAKPDKAKKMLGWQTQKSLEEILQDALNWQIEKNKTTSQS